MGWTVIQKILSAEFKKQCALARKDRPGKLVWQQSQGCLDKLREYIDTESSHTHIHNTIQTCCCKEHSNRGWHWFLLQQERVNITKQIEQKFPANGWWELT